MKRRMSLWAIVLFSILVLMFTACGGGGGGGGGGGERKPPPGPPDGATLLNIMVSPATASIEVGKTKQFTATGTYDDGKNYDITGTVLWESSNTSSATVSALGLAQGISSGTATITAGKDALSDSSSLDVTVAPGSFSNQGTSGNPVTITLNTPYSGQVSGEDPLYPNSYYRVAVTPGHNYFVTLTELTGPANVLVYDQSDFTSLLCESHNNYGGSSVPYDDEWCTTDPAASNNYLYIRVFGGWTHTFYGQPGGANYKLTVTRGYLDEGDTFTPVALDVGVPYSGQVGEGTSYYSVPIESGAKYNVTLTSLTGLADLDVGTGWYSSCTSANAGMTEEQCLVRLYGTTMTIMTNGEYATAGSGYTITVTKTAEAYVSEGTLDTPADLSGMPYSGQVGPPLPGKSRGYSYYAFPVTQDRPYRITLTGMDKDSGVWVYDGDSTYSSSLACWSDNFGIQDDQCDVEPATSTMFYIKVATGSNIGAGFVLNVQPIEYTPEGSDAAPMLLGAAPLTHQGMVNTSASYYEVPVEAERANTVSLSQTFGDLDLYVYDDDAMTTELCSATTIGTGDESCLTSPAPSSGSIYVVVDGSTSNFGSTYDLTVTEYYVSEGTSGSPASISVPYDGEVSTTADSYYSLSGLTIGQKYSVIISNRVDSLDMRVLRDPAIVSSYYCWESGGSSEELQCNITPEDTTVYFKMASGYYSWSGSTFTINVIDAIPSEGTTVDPIDLGSVSVTGYAGTVDDTLSYYMVQVSAGTQYTIEITDPTRDVQFDVWDNDSSFNIMTDVCTGYSYSGGSSYSCTATASGSALYFAVESISFSNNIGAEYTINVQ